MPQRFIWVAVVLFALLALVTVRTFLSTDSPEKHVVQGVAPRYTPEEKTLADEMLDFDKALGLTAAQKQKFQELEKAFQPRFQAIRRKHRLTKANYATEQPALRAELAPVEAEYKKQKEAIYTREQWAKIQAFRESATRALPRGRHPGLISQ